MSTSSVSRNHPKTLAPLFLTAMLALSFGCSSSKDALISNPFPERAKLQKLASSKPARSPAINTGKPVAAMAMQGGLPNQIGASSIVASTPLEQAIASATQNTDVSLTSQASCVAKQHAEFHATHQKSPYRMLKDFINHRCGSTATYMNTQWWSYTRANEDGLAPEAFDAKLQEELFNDQDFLNRLKESVAQIAENVGDHGEIGIGYARVEQNVILMLAYGKRKADIQTTSMFPDASGNKTFKGVVHSPGESVYGMVTSGPFDYEMCSTDASVALPNFSVTCPTTATDERNRIVLFLSKKDAIFSSSIFDQSVWPRAGKLSSPPPVEFRSVTPQNLTLKEGASPNETMLDLINQVRGLAGQKPLSLSKEQGQMNAALAPHLFEAFENNDYDTEREITLGIMAGWEIKGPVVDGDVLALRFPNSDPLLMIDTMMALPQGRKLLFGKDSQRIALGQVPGESGTLGMLVSVYDFLPDETNAARVSRVWTRLHKARKLQGRRKISRSKKLFSTRKRLSKELTAGEISLREAADELAEKMVQAYNKPVRYFYFPTHDLDKLQFNADLMTAKNKRALILTAPFNQKDYPWMIYGVVIVVVDK